MRLETKRLIIRDYEECDGDDSNRENLKYLHDWGFLISYGCKG